MRSAVMISPTTKPVDLADRGTFDPLPNRAPGRHFIALSIERAITRFKVS